jgi:hypothetical protein
MREYPQLRGLPPLEALAKYLSGPAVAHHSVCLQLAQHAPAAIQFFALRDAFGIGGYMTEEQAIAAIKSTLGVSPVEASSQQVDDALADAMIDANLSPKFCIEYAATLQAFGRAVWKRAYGVNSVRADQSKGGA